MDIEPGELTVGQLSQRSGVAISALHFYERQNLILSRRTSGNQRRYKRDTLRRVALIRIAQRVGIPLAEVAAILAQLRDDFKDCVGCGCLSLDRCALANPYDALAAKGPGPQRLVTAEGEPCHPGKCA